MMPAKKKCRFGKNKRTGKCLKQKRMDYKNMTYYEAQKLLDESRGMPKEKWEKLWKISRDMTRISAKDKERLSSTLRYPPKSYGIKKQR